MTTNAKPARRWGKLAPYAFISPGLVVMAIGTFIPAIVTAFVAMTNYSLIHLQDWKFIGFENFKKIIAGASRGEFFYVLGWNVTWTVGSTLLAFSLGIILALLLNDPHIRERNFYRTILILPWALPSTITVLTWAGLLSTSFGPINKILTGIGLSAVPWLTNATWARLSCMLVNLWIGFPFMMATSLGALQSIPQEVYDAGKVDGADGWHLFWHITFPLLRMATLPLLISGFAMQFSNFTVIFLLTNGGPFVITKSMAGATDLLATYMYKMAFASTSLDYGLASANGILLFLIVGTLTIINSKITGAFKEVD